MLFIFSTPVLIRHLWQLKTVFFLHWCLIFAVLLVSLCSTLTAHVCSLSMWMKWSLWREVVILLYGLIYHVLIRHLWRLKTVFSCTSVSCVLFYCISTLMLSNIIIYRFSHCLSIEPAIFCIKWKCLKQRFEKTMSVF